MKKIFLLLPVFFLLAVRGVAQTKRALIIAIGNYPAAGGWDYLNCLNDVPVIQNALVKQDFLPQNIRLLTDAQATKKGIIDALDQLIADSKKGDVVVIHVSSHGEQIEDDNGDEADGKDETIVPYDAIYSDDKTAFNKLSQGYIRDDTFGEKITLLRNKLGRNGDVLVTLDACHSASGTRGGGAKVRGGKAPMVSAGFDEKKIGMSDTAGVFRENNNVKLNSDAASYVLISAALAQELNCECYDDQRNAVGSLSYAFGKVLSSLDGKITYRTLFSRMDDVLQQKVSEKPMPNCKQNPALEGDGIDRELFGGKYEQQAAYFTVNRKKSNSTAVEIDGGTISGITVGSVVSFYPDNVLNPAGKTALQKGRVIAAQNFSSIVKPDKPNPALLRNIVRAFVTETSYGINKIKLSLDSLDDATKKKVLDSLKGFQLAEINPKCELYLAKSKRAEGFAFYYPVSGDVFTDTLDINTPGAIRDALKRYDRFRYLQGLRFNEPGLSANVDLVFLDANGNIDSNKINKQVKLGKLILKEGDVVHLRVVNTSNKPFFINVVDIQPNGIINPIIPNKDSKVSVDECKVDMGATYIFRNDIAIYPPYGNEIFKVFLSANSLDLEKILVTKKDAGARGGGVLSSLEKVFKDSEVNEVGSRGGGNVNTQNGTIFNLNFTIVPDKD